MKRFAAGCMWLVLLAVLVFLWPSCTIVKEGRRDCPCTLSVEMRSLPLCPVRLYADGRLAGEALRDTCLSVMVSRGPQSVLAAVAGAVPGTSVAPGMGALEVRIPYGSESPPLYAWSAVADCSGDTGSATVRLFRHFCNLVLDVVSPPGWDQPFQAAVRGEVDGWSLTAGPGSSVGAAAFGGGAPTAGPFRCTLSSGYTCRLPRQWPGGELWLDIVMPEGIVRTFPLGAVLLRSGYDWTAPDLPDIGLRLDLSVTQITLSYGVFSEVFPLEIII